MCLPMVSGYYVNFGVNSLPAVTKTKQNKTQRKETEQRENSEEAQRQETT